MRIPLALALAAALAAAEPTVRWITPTGQIRADAVAEVLEEAVDHVRVRLADGQEKEIPGTALVELVREGEGEKDLLEARLKAIWGIDPEGARATLDALLKAQGAAGLPAGRAWVREYAEAARAVVAERLREPDAAARIDAFLKERPTSRLAPHLLMAQARLESAAIPGDDPAVWLPPFHRVYLRIEEMRGPRLFQLLTYRDGHEAIRGGMEADRTTFLESVERRMDQIRSGDSDLPFKICAQTLRMWLRLDHALRGRKGVLALGMQPVGALARIETIRNESRFLLPELISDVRYELGECYRLCGSPADAVTEWTASRDVAPDPVRRARAEAALKSAAG